MEMLTGRPVFDGETVSHVLAAVLTKDPDWTTLPAGTPASIRKLLRRCLDKDRKRRLDSAADARLEIDDALTPAEVSNQRTPLRMTSRAILVSVCAAAIAAFATWPSSCCRICLPRILSG